MFRRDGDFFLLGTAMAEPLLPKCRIGTAGDQSALPGRMAGENRARSEAETVPRFKAAAPGVVFEPPADPEPRETPFAVLKPLKARK